MESETFTGRLYQKIPILLFKYLIINYLKSHMEDIGEVSAVIALLKLRF